MESWKDRLYPHLPVFAQNLACSYYGFREGRVRFNRLFEETLESLERTQHYSASDARAYQDEQVERLIKHAHAHVPYYREVMERLRLKPSDIRKVADLPKLPILTKEDVRQNGSRLLAANASKRELIAMHSSGTTGKSLHFFVARAAIALRWAVWWRHRRRFGLQPSDWHVNFTGKRVVPGEQKRPPYWRWNLPTRQALLNMQHLVPDKIPEIAQFLSSHDFAYFSGYPSIVHALAKEMLDAKLELARKPRVVVTGAENMMAYQRRDIAAVTGAVLTDQYGFSEGCGNASHCTALAYHEDFEVGVLELESATRLPAENAEQGGILATGFGCWEFPFIRYQVGDVGVWADPSSSCECGLRTRRMLRIDGRLDDYVVTPEGRSIMRFDYLFKDTVNIKEAQIVQRVPDEIEIVLVPRPAYSSKDEEALRALVAEWISPRLRVRFSSVGEIPREPNGKFRAVKSYLTRTEGTVSA
jgi:phenylacetate-CoA ligase